MRLLRNFLALFLLAAPLLIPHSALAQQDSPLPGNRYVKARIASDRLNIQPSGDEAEPAATLAIVLEVEPGWHVYWKNSGDSGSPPEVKWTLPEGWSTSDLIWPAPKRIRERGDIITFGYNSNVTLASKLFTPAVIPDHTEEIEVSARVRWLVCEEICVPGEAELSQTFQYGTDVPLGPSDDISRIGRTLAEAPMSVVEAASKFPKLASLSIDTLSPEVAARNETLRLGLKLQGINKADAATAEYLQFFPFSNPYLQFGDPKLKMEADGSPVIVCDIRVLSGAPEEEYEVGGLLLLAPKLSGSDNPVSILWTSRVQVKGDSPGSQPSASSEDGLVALSYRTYQSKERPELEASDPPAVVEFSWSAFGAAIFFGFIAGVILNLMPCVLPIISIKVMGFINMGGIEQSEARRTVYAFSAGIIFSFLSLAAIVVSLRDVGMRVGWGFQFQHPAVVFLMFIVVFVLSLVFFDVYTFKIPYLNSANRAVTKMQPSMLSHFLEGILVTALSTPCTAPFLGTALAFAFVQPAVYTFAVFLSIGLGLALPYALLATNPALLRVLPKPGPWEYRLKEFLGFLLLGTAIWLLFVLDSLTQDGTVWAVAAAVFIFFCLWLTKNAVEFIANSKLRAVFNVFLAIAFVWVLASLWPKVTQRSESPSEVSQSEKISWESYSPSLVNSALDSGQTVFIDFTADWCVTCKANEKLVIETDAVADFIREHNILPVKADWTSGDDEISEALYSYGAQGVPLYVIIAPDRRSEPLLLPTLLTQSILLDGLKSSI